MMSDMRSPSRATEHAPQCSCNPSRLSLLVGKLLAAAMITSFVVGSLATAFQYIRVVPLILQAEAYERRRLEESEEWAPADGAERGAFTWLSNILVSFSFALLLLGISLVDNVHVSLRSGLQRGAAGWTIFMALPCAGLSPELPGMAAAELTERQWWWLYAILFAAVGFAVALFATRLPTPPAPSSAESSEGFHQLTTSSLHYWTLQALLLAIAVTVAAVPHISGAPHPYVGHGDHVATSTSCGAGHTACARPGPPSEMAASYAVWCLATAFAYWLVLGVVAAACFNRAMCFASPMPRELIIEALKGGEAAAAMGGADAAAQVTVEAV